MSQFDVILLTESRYDRPTTVTPYVQNILTEDRLVQQALEKKGLRVARKDWADPGVDWNQTKTALFRTTWDYFDQFPRFSDWLDATATKTYFINPIEQIRWNMDKHYLLDLQEKGINIPPTVMVETGETTTLEAIHRQTGWKKSVLKPAISGAARHTYLLHADQLDQHETIFQQLIARESMMIQEFQEFVVETGEVSLMLFDGQYSHAVLKVAKAGDFRVQDDFGGTLHDYTPSREEIDFAIQVVEACSPVPAYARVDLIKDNQQQNTIIEVELIEPELWFRRDPLAAELLAEAVCKRL
jgi:glutathione synthase/RimK-type ligase-like ATP-grasp enzyme